MHATPRAEALIGPAREALALLRGLARGEPAFDPGAAQRGFRICMTDASHVTLLPSLLAHVRGVAQGVRLHVSPISAATATMLQAPSLRTTSLAASREVMRIETSNPSSSRSTRRSV